MKTQKENSAFAHGLEIMKRIEFRNYSLKIQTHNLTHGLERTNHDDIY